MKRSLFFLCCLLWCGSAVAQDGSRAAGEAIRLAGADTARARADARWERAWSLYRAEQFDSALVHFKAALDIQEEWAGADPNRTAEILFYTSEILWQHGNDPAQAKRYLERALERTRTLDDRSNLPVMLYNLGGISIDLGDFESARTRYEQALDAYESAYGKDHPVTAPALKYLGWVAIMQEKYGVARKRYAQALEVYGSDPDTYHRQMVEILDESGSLEYGVGNHESALSYYERGLALCDADPGDHPERINILENLAWTLYEMGEYRAALPHYRRIVEIRLALHGEHHAKTADARSGIAGLLRDLGYYPEARSHLIRALATKESTLGKEHPEVAELLNNLGAVFHSQGDYRKALSWYRRALETEESALGKQHYQLASTLNNMGLVNDAMQNFEAARKLYERSLAILEHHSETESSDGASVINNLGLLYHKQGAYREALSRYRRALEIRTGIHGEGHVKTANSLSTIGTLLHEQGKPAEARPYLERTFAIRETVLGPGHPDVATSLGYLGELALDEGDPDGAHAYLTDGARRYDRFSQKLLPSLSGAEQRSFVNLELDRQVSLLLNDIRRNPAHTDTYGIFGGWKGLLQQQLRRQSRISSLGDDPAFAEPVGELQALRRSIAQAYQNGGDLAALTDRKEQLERELSTALDDAGEDLWREKGLEGLRNRLSSDRAFADFYRYGLRESGPLREQRYGVLLIRRGKMTFTDLGDAGRIDSLAAAWRTEVTRGRPAEAETAELAKAVWKPLADRLPAEVRQLWLSPDARLARIPWSVIARSHEPTGDLLLAEVASARALLRQLDRPPSPAGSGEILLVGDVRFSGASPTRSASRHFYGPLPGTADEIAGIARLAREQQVETRRLTGEEATPSAVAEAMQQSAYVHLATHGFFFRDTGATVGSRNVKTLSAGTGPGPGAFSRNPLVESGLALSGANAGPAGTLTAEELIGTELDGARLITLSACDTGRGTEVTGQGVMGLRSSLEAAGARSLLMSLWKVPDASTALLMETFYRELWENGYSPAEALRKAQEEVRRRPEYRAPLHWAAWTLTGDVFNPI